MIDDMNPGPFTVALLEDEPGTRQRLTHAIETDPLALLLWAGASARECMRWLETHRVDVLLVDLRLPDGSGTDVIRHCRAWQPQCDVMVVTMFADQANMIDAFAAGARGYLLKDGTEEDLARHVYDLRAGGSPMSPPIARRLLQLWHWAGSGGGAAAGRGLPPVPPMPPLPTAAALPPASPLTPRETDVLALVARGFTYDEVAQQLSVTVATVRTHVRAIYSKLDVHNKTEAVFEARAQGLLN